MAMWLQHLLVLLIVAACLAAVLGQSVRTLRGRKSKIGACCAKGCDSAGAVAPKAENKSAPQRIVFFPADMLRKR